jgi:hypothetical protein
MRLADGCAARGWPTAAADQPASAIARAWGIEPVGCRPIPSSGGQITQEWPGPPAWLARALMISARQHGGNEPQTKPIARLEQWRVIRLTEGTEHLVGIVYRHPRIRPGGRIVSSAILAGADAGRFAETENTFYILGAPGVGELPDEWREAVDRFLRLAWGTVRA